MMSKNSFVMMSASVLVACSGVAAAQCPVSEHGSSPSKHMSADHGSAPAAIVQASYSAQPGTIVGVASSAGTFKTLLAAAEAAGLVGALTGEGPLTVFAPTDEAFSNLPAGTVETLLKPENKDTLASILKYHVVAGEFTSGQVTRLDGATTLNGQRLTFATSPDGVMIDGARVVAADVDASNGVIHVIDKVMLPASDTIVGVAQSAGTFKTLLAAAEAAGLVDALSGDGPLTVFAPTDQAFGELPAGTVKTLLKPENRDQLRSILLYHVVPGRVYAGTAAGAGRAKTLQGGEVLIGITNGQMRVDGANIIGTDIDASNGVVHVIDRVILPTNG